MSAWDVKTWEGKKVFIHAIQHRHMKEQEGVSFFCLTMWKHGRVPNFKHSIYDLV